MNVISLHKNRWSDSRKVFVSVIEARVCSEAADQSCVDFQRQSVKHKQHSSCSSGEQNELRRILGGKISERTLKIAV
jgi:hypothetical protein